MARQVKVLTGPGETDRFGFNATDLGYPFKTQHGYTITLFGDTFNNTPDPDPDPDWRSPVGLRQSNPDIHNGIQWDNAIGGARAKQLFPYQHGGDEGTTQIPCDGIHLPDGRYFATAFMVKDWHTDPTQGMCHTLGARWWTSTQRDAEDWERTIDLDTGRQNFDFPNEGKWWWFQNSTMIMLDPTGHADPFVYLYGTKEGRYRGAGAGIYLARCDWRHLNERHRWEFWGQVHGRWGWSTDRDPWPIITPTFGGFIGELNAQVIDGRVVLAYQDEFLGAVTRTSPRPEGTWTLPKLHVTHIQQPSLYAPAIHPYSRLDRAQMLLSQWVRAGSTTLQYRTVQWEVDLRGFGVDLLPRSVRGVVSGFGDTPAGEGSTGPLTAPLDAIGRSMSAKDLKDLLSGSGDAGEGSSSGGA